jgi:hypothetical protein
MADVSQESDFFLAKQKHAMVFVGQINRLNQKARKWLPQIDMIFFFGGCGKAASPKNSCRIPRPFDPGQR